MPLPVPYFLLTFTLPAELRSFARQDQRRFYRLLFRASAAATQQLAHDPRFIGGQIGLLGLLHSWTRDLRYHPHVHYLVPAGGLAADGQTWLAARKNFLLPVRALSRLFRGHFQRALQKTPGYAEVPERVWSQEWVVHCKAVGQGATALKYLAPYIFRVALSNRRLVKVDNDRVTFRYTQAKTGQTRFCTLPAEQFIQRFLQHVLPKGFVKVRYYGLFGRRCAARLAALQQQLRQSQSQSTPNLPAATSPSASVGFPPGSLSLRQPVHCPRCGTAMPFSHTLPVLARSPP